MHEDDLDRFKKFAKDSLNGIEGKCKIRTLTAENKYVWYELNSMVIRDENDEVSEILGKMKNINNEQIMMDKHNQLNKYFTAMQELSDNILYKIDVKTMTLHHMVQNGNKNLIGNTIPNYIETIVNQKIVHPDDAEIYIQHVKDWYDDKEEECTVRFAIESDEYQWYRVTGKKIFNKNGILTEIFGQLINVQERKELEELASYDMMTNVLNKVSFENQVTKILDNSNKENSHALFFIDLDDFKYVNDNLGHSFGDYLLIELGKRLRKSVREIDLIGRVGGDEFVIFVKDISNNKILIEKAEKILVDINQEIFDETNRHKIKASIGIATYPKHGENYEQLYSNADVALYNSKRKGKNVATVFSH